jgi:hypothetical protein
VPSYILRTILSAHRSPIVNDCEIMFKTIPLRRSGNQTLGILGWSENSNINDFGLGCNDPRQFKIGLN